MANKIMHHMIHGDDTYEIVDKVARKGLSDITIKDLKGKAISHRGYGWQGTVLPNICQSTLRSFSLAKDNGYKCIETDVQKDVNGVICCFHDTTVDSTTNGTGNFKDNDYTELLLKDGNGNITSENVITLDETCRWASLNDVIVDVEIEYGSSYNEVSIQEIVDIAIKYGTKIVVNCGNSLELLNECQSDYPTLWKESNLWGDTALTKTDIDEIVSDGYTNLLLYSQVRTYDLGEISEYAYDHGILLLKTVDLYSTDTSDGYGMTMSTRGRPNYKSPIAYDSGYISVDNAYLLNDYTSASDSWKFKFRRIGNIVEIRGLIKNSTWTALPGAGNRKDMYVLPPHFRPVEAVRYFAPAGDGMDFFHTTNIAVSGTIIPCFTVTSDATLEKVKSDFYPIFCSFTCADIVG